MSDASQNYHHGDLRATLLRVATERVVNEGIDSLSLRKLAEEAGVSRTAPYHHFKDKNALLNAIAAQGFAQWHEKASEVFDDESLTPHQRFKAFFRNYISWAADNPQLYELMFGRTIWQAGNATDDLTSIAFPSFQFLVKITAHWQEKGILPENQDPLRLTQVTWGTMHGIARLVIDGIYAESSHINEMCDCAADMFMQAASAAHDE
ncbi:TetR/AcrR family transcriptional regulator [Alteromonas antoniana]|uniref:TetR/AcrR family transcriptional regulator n=1 Tax=Alteromonas antoniana TaxID=2803813 RepID=UPI001C472BCB|nr:TetR/AcrR family transcriptional regulator [Alteromonas antoniana]